MRLAPCLILVLTFFIAFDATGYEIAGTVLDMANQRVSDATVWLDQNRKVQKTSTDKEGRFSFAKAAGGTTQVVAAKEGHALGGFNLFVIGNTNRDIQLGLPGEVNLRISDGKLAPIAGARVKAIIVQDEFLVPVEDLNTEGFPELRTGDDGMLAIPQLPQDGFVQLLISQIKFADARIPFIPVREKRQTLVMYSGIRLQGRVLYEGKPVQGAHVTIFQTGTQGQREAADADSDNEGLFSVRVPEGNYFVGVTHADYGSPEPAYVGVVDDSEKNVVELTLQKPRVLRGMVMDPKGKPAGGICVAFRAGKGIQQQTYTDNAGNYTIKVGQDDGLVSIQPPHGYMTDSLNGVQIKLAGKTHGLVPPFRLVALPVLEGTIYEEGKKAVANALISSVNLPSPVWAITDSAGHFSIHLDYQLDQEVVEFRAEHPQRFLREEFKIDLRHNKPAKVRLKPFDPDLGKREVRGGQNDLTKLVGKPAPDLEARQWFNTPQTQGIKDVTGTAPTVPSIEKGKVTVLFFWGGFDNSPIGRSRLDEIRALNELLKELDDVRFIGLHDSTSDADEVKTYCDRLQVAFPVGLDKDPFVTFGKYNINVIPQPVLVDKMGIVRYFQTDGRLLELIKDLRRRQ